MGSRITAENNLFDYFHLAVQDAKSEAHVQLSDDTSLYLANLLTERARTDREAPQGDTLAELHAAACQARPAEQARTWRELGDRALYDLGTCREHLQARKIVSLGYYEAMGRQAYRRVDEVFKRFFADAFGPLFGELAARFKECERVLLTVREAQSEHDPLDRLYQQWLATGSEELARELRERGLVLPRRPADAGSA